MDRNLRPPPHQRLLQLCPERHRLQRAQPRQPAQLRRCQCHQEDHGHQHLAADAAQPGYAHQCPGYDDGHSWRLPLQQGECCCQHWVEVVQRYTLCSVCMTMSFSVL